MKVLVILTALIMLCLILIVVAVVTDSHTLGRYAAKGLLISFIGLVVTGVTIGVCMPNRSLHRLLCLLPKRVQVYDEIMAIQGIEPIEAEMEEVWHCPDGYIFKDENGNVINATKIVLEKKKKEYPKTYEECCKVLGIEGNLLLAITKHITDYERTLWNRMGHFRGLIICRDAYWKIAGEEMGLGKPWEPSGNEDCFVISRSCGEVFLYESAGDNEPFEFPTPEMRDAFYENFKELIEQCKELL